MATFVEVMENKPQPTLKAIAEIFEVPAQRLYSVAKQPKAGEVYDAHVYNWDAISRFIEKRIGKEGDKFETFEEVYEAAMAKDEELAASDKRRGANRTARAKIDCGEGKQMPARKGDFAVGDKVCVKKNPGVIYDIVYLTTTHTVLRPQGSDLLTCLSNWTFNQTVTPCTETAATEDAE